LQNLINLKYKSFETERLILKPTTIEDAEMILELMNSPKWIENIGDRNVNNLDEAKAYIEEKIKPQLIRLGYSNYTLIRKSDNQKVGSCGLYDREGLEGVDLGFALLPQHEKNGYAYESATAILKAATTIFGTKEVKAITTKANKESQRLLEKLGLKFDKLIRIPNDHEELMLYRYQSND